MVETLRITENDLAALTQTEIDILKQILNTGDRGGFYMAYYAMTGSEQAELQSRIATFSGDVGHAAFAANRLLQEAFGPGTGQSPEYAGIYRISQLVALEGLSKIEDDALNGTTGGKISETLYEQAPSRLGSRRGRKTSGAFGNSCVRYLSQAPLANPQLARPSLPTAIRDRMTR